MCLDASDELVEPDGLGEEVIGTRVERLDDALGVIGARHQDERQRRGLRPAPQRADEVDAVHAGHPEVSDDAPDLVAGQRRLGSGRAGGTDSPKAGTAKGDRHDGQEVGVVLHDEDCGSVGSRSFERVGVTS